MTPEYYGTCSHLRTVLNTVYRRELARQAANVIRSATDLPCIEAIACQGLSGILFATALSQELNLPMCVVRKEENPMAHSSEKTEGPDDPCRPFMYLFVDDLISTGSTLRRVQGCMSSKYMKAQLAAILLYEDTSYNTLEYAKVNVPVFTQHGRFKAFDQYLAGLSASTSDATQYEAITIDPKFYMDGTSANP